MVRIVQLTGGGEQTQHRLFPEHGRHEGYTDVDVTALCPYAEMSVLGNSLLRNVQISHDFDSGNQGLMDISLQSHILKDYAVNPHPYFCLALKRLNMDIAGIAFNRPFNKTVQ